MADLYKLFCVVLLLQLLQLLLIYNHRQPLNRTLLSTFLQDRDCIIYDDIADRCDSIVKTAEFLKQEGAKRVFCMVTHGLFTKESLQVSCCAFP